MDRNDTRALDALLQDAARQQQAQQLLNTVLQQTLQNPAIIKRASTNLVKIEEQDGLRVLLVATPNGERWEVPLSDIAVRQLLRDLGTEEQAA